MLIGAVTCRPGGGQPEAWVFLVSSSSGEGCREGRTSLSWRGEAQPGVRGAEPRGQRGCSWRGCRREPHRPAQKGGVGEWWPSDGQVATRMGSSPPAACHSSETFGCEPQSLGIGLLEPISRDKKKLSSKSGWFLTGLAHGRTTPGPEAMLWHPECPDAQVSEQGGAGSCTEGLVRWQDSKPPRCNQGTGEFCSERRLEQRPQSPSPSVPQEHHPGLPDEHGTHKQAVLTQPQSRLCSPSAARHRAAARRSQALRRLGQTKGRAPEPSAPEQCCRKHSAVCVRDPAGGGRAV